MVKCVPRGEGHVLPLTPTLVSLACLLYSLVPSSLGEQSGGVRPELGTRMSCDLGRGDLSSVLPLEDEAVLGGSLPGDSPEYCGGKGVTQPDLREAGAPQPEGTDNLLPDGGGRSVWTGGDSPSAAAAQLWNPSGPL